MRVYILSDRETQATVGTTGQPGIEETYYLVENIESFTKTFAREGWMIDANFAATDDGNRWMTLAQGLEDDVATKAMRQLLRLTSDIGEGTAIIRWNGKKFKKQLL